MCVRQTKDDLIKLCDVTINVTRMLLLPLPFSIAQEIQFELESYGYDIIWNHSLSYCRNDIKYLTKSMTNYRQKLLGNRGKRLRKYKVLQDDIEYSMDDATEQQTKSLDRAYISSLPLSKHHKKHIYWVVVMIVRGSLRPVQDAAEHVGVSRMAINRSLQEWRKHYANEVDREVCQVRSLRHLQKLLRWGTG
jgi:hypothetical protein